MLSLILFLVSISILTSISIGLRASVSVGMNADLPRRTFLGRIDTLAQQVHLRHVNIITINKQTHFLKLFHIFRSQYNSIRRSCLAYLCTAPVVLLALVAFELL